MNTKTHALDFLNKPLSVGDYVVVVRKNYRDLVVAKVTGWTNKSVRVVYMASWSQHSIEEYLTNQLIKVEPSQLEINDKQKADEAFDKLTEKVA